MWAVARAASPLWPAAEPIRLGATTGRRRAWGVAAFCPIAAAPQWASSACSLRPHLVRLTVLLVAVALPVTSAVLAPARATGLRWR